MMRRHSIRTFKSPVKNSTRFITAAPFAVRLLWPMSQLMLAAS